MSLCLFCGSRKPAPGIHSVSASREMLKEIQQGVASTGIPSTFLDLREYALPFWDGRSFDEYDSADLERLYVQMNESSGFILSVPAYWNSISGCVKNVFDLVGSEPFEGKLVGLLIVGMDDASAWNGARQMKQIVESLGGWSPPEAMVVGNPRHIEDHAELRRHLRRFGAYVGFLLSGKMTAFPTLSCVGNEEPEGVQSR